MKKLILFSIFALTAVLPGYSQTKVKIINIQNSIINPITVGYIERGLKKAEIDNGILIIELDTPGGLLQSTEEIVKLILNTGVPVITYIYPRGAKAASAGVFIGYASHILAMSPSTRIGAAHPLIGPAKWGSLDPELKKKILNDTVSWAQNIARQRNRSALFIEEAVKKSVSVTETEAIKGWGNKPKDEGRGVRDEKDKKKKEEGKEKLIVAPPETREEPSGKIADVIADDIGDLLKKINNTTVTTVKGQIKIATDAVAIEEINLTGREKFLDTIINPNIAYLLLLIGVVGLIVEMTAPGVSVPGITGIICLIASFYALSILPVNYAGIALIILGLIFFIAEAFTPAFGGLLLGGIISFTLGSIMLFNQREFLTVSLKIILPIVASVAALILFLLGKVIAARKQKPKTGNEGMLNQPATAYTDIAGEGKVFLRGEIWDAQSDEPIKKGESVIITKIEGLRVWVKKK
jgi:membrane-bound serine protease (ClpP class)